MYVYRKQASNECLNDLTEKSCWDKPQDNCIVTIRRLGDLCLLYEHMAFPLGKKKKIVYIIPDSQKEGAEPIKLWQATWFLNVWGHLELIAPFFIFSTPLIPTYSNTNLKQSLSTVMKAIQLIIKRHFNHDCSINKLSKV